MIAISSPSSVELEPSSGVLEQKQADAYELKTAGRVAPSPVTGRNVSVSYVMRHPQFDADIVEDHETGVQFARRRVRSMFARRGLANRLEDGPPPQVDPPPSAAALARLGDKFKSSFVTSAVFAELKKEHAALEARAAAAARSLKNAKSIEPGDDDDDDDDTIHHSDEDD